jgi:hypothetical protein
MTRFQPASEPSFFRFAEQAVFHPLHEVPPGSEVTQPPPLIGTWGWSNFSGPEGESG